MYREHVHAIYNDMAQLNLNLNEEFSRDLQELMDKRRIKTKADAIRIAVKETLKSLTLEPEKNIDFTQWIGLAKSPAKRRRVRFKTHAEVWEKD